jgi:hypothetical protein
MFHKVQMISVFISQELERRAVEDEKNAR